jgi:hypothetical protein
VWYELVRLSRPTLRSGQQSQPSVEFLHDEPASEILLQLFGLLIVGTELGFRLGRRQAPSRSETVRGQVRNIQGTLMGLLALLLGFTFAMSVSRFDNRRHMVVKEANAIGTAALRAHVLPAAEQAAMRDLFRRYVDVRVDAGHEDNMPKPERDALDAKAHELQGRLWHHAALAAEADPHSVAAGLLLSAMNDVIDVKAERDASLANHVPESVLLLLFAFAVLASGILGYSTGLAGTRIIGMPAAFALLVTLVLMVILDLDRPRRGLILVGQDSMIAVQRSLETSK